MQIEISNITIEVTKKKIKNLHLRVKPDGTVTLSAPSHLTLEEIDAFARSKIEWIKKQKERIENQSPARVCEYASGEEFFLFGVRYILRVVDGTRYLLSFSDDEIILTCPADSTREKRERFINECYRDMLYGRIEYYLPKWEQVTGLYSDSWQIRNMKTRWGTCNPRTKKIWFNLQLAKKSDECIWYVILHELAHLKVYDHGPCFKSILDRHMPNWREVKKLLNE